VTAPPDEGDVLRFRDLVARSLGLHLEDARLGQLADVLRARLAATSLAAGAYLDLLEAGPSSPPGELRALAAELTVGETYFFRNPDQFRAFVEVALPARMRVRQDRRRLRILSAGCASGEEPYSLAILASERGDPSWEVSIRAVDLSAPALARAARGQYSSWALRETPAETRARWFRPRGRDFVLDDAVRASVTFEEKNLAAPDPELWPPSWYDVVFCRNVIMYFAPEPARALVERIAGALAPGGYLFLGHAETLRGLSPEFHLHHTHGTFYYERRSGPAGPALGEAVLRADPPRPPPGAPAWTGTAWVETIRRASDRIHALAEARQPPASISPSATVPGPGGPSPSLAGAVELLEKERFGEALDLVHALPSESAGDPDVLLLRATLLTHDGRLDEAERACRELLAVDELNAGAHYLLALCREDSGDSPGASHQDRLAAYLDPDFAMPRLHLGLLARKAGDLAGACRELSHALELLRREEPARLLMFGGGFGREALAALCRAEIAACGGKA